MFTTPKTFFSMPNEVCSIIAPDASPVIKQVVSSKDEVLHAIGIYGLGSRMDSAAWSILHDPLTRTMRQNRILGEILLFAVTCIISPL